jgi:hypothetical protein
MNYLIFLIILLTLFFLLWPFRKKPTLLCNCKPVLKNVTMALNNITIDFNPCSPPPANGYKVLYRIAGTLGAYRDGGNFSASPIVIHDTDPVGTQYEGILKSDCGDGIYGPDVPFTTSGSGGGGGGTPTCHTYHFTVIGADSDQYRVTGIHCDGTGYDSGLQLCGDGAPAAQCLQDGTVTIFGQIIIDDSSTVC